MSDDLILHFDDKIVKLTISNDLDELDVDDLLKIDYNNIIGEIITFPVIVNKVGVLRAELENQVNESKFELEVIQAELAEKIRKEKSTETIDKSGVVKVKTPTIPEVENAVLLDPYYQEKKLIYFDKIKQFNYLDSLYWACKDKSKKLDYCSNGIKQEDFSKNIIEDTINNINIKVKNPVIR